MADIPDEYLDDFEAGHFPASDARDWLRENMLSDEARDIREFMDDGLSLEWAFAAADEGMPPPSEWDHVTIERDTDGSWDVHISAGGESFTIDAADSDAVAADNIWSDFYFHVIDEYDIDVDREISYGEPT